jgi:group I intron endonuclease
MGIIYKSTNLINGKCYIGKSVTKLKYRKSQHRHYAFEKNGQDYFHSALRKYGIENFKWEVIYECDDKLILNIMETMKIIVNHSHYTEGKGYNLTWGGECGQKKGFKHTEETKKKMSKSHTGVSRTPHTEETKRKMSKSAKGKKKSIEARQNMSKSKKGCVSPRKGCVLSEETIRKIQNTKKINSQKRHEKNS